MAPSDNELKSAIQLAAWQLYCDETKGDMDVRDSWEQLPGIVQSVYLQKVFENSDSLFFAFSKISENLTPVGAAMILDERKRQIYAEGWSASRDDRYTDGSLAGAASAYLLHARSSNAIRTKNRRILPNNWPWASRWWKPGPDDSIDSKVRELVKAGALISAEIDRLLRAKEYDAELERVLNGERGLNSADDNAG